MGKIVYIMGKSSTGKDTIYKRLLNNEKLKLKTIVPYTTRPIRVKETQGVEYHFVDEKEYERLKNLGKIIEERSYNTCLGLWRYFTVYDGNIDLDTDNYIMIGTLEAYAAMRDYFGKNTVLPVLIESDDGTRLERALRRERKQPQPKYEEMCRRYLADSEDFAEEKIRTAGIEKRFYNEDLEQCITEIESYLCELCVESVQ
jgi:guanylate kinase